MPRVIKRPAKRKPGRPLGVVVEKPCEQCGEIMPRKLIGKRLEFPVEYERRRFCNSRCYGDSKVGVWQDDVLPHQGRYRARQTLPWAPCEDCGGDQNVDVHHLDENPLNNDPSNLANLCRRCHYRRHNPVVACSIDWCDRPVRRNGLCDGHDQRRKRGMDMSKPFQQRKKAR